MPQSAQVQIAKESSMRKLLSLLVVLAPVALVGCGSDDTYVIPPSSPSPGAVVIPQQPAPTVVVPQQAPAVKVCPQGQMTC